ncbi:MAG: patatin-like phospholipase family protein [Rubricoccaceae bacterium]
MRASLRPLLLVLCAGASVALAGCAGSARPVSTETLVAAREARQARYTLARAEVAARLAARVAATGQREVHMLVLSGGGQHGAFGAGFLGGWRARTGAGAMPSFDVVTGISTGSLLAPFAFEGSPEALARAADLYRHPERITPRRDLAGALFRRTGGLFDTTPLVETAAEVYDAALVARLRPGLRDGRLLLIGTTDLDLGRGRVWDAARELDTTDAAAAARLSRLLLASSAIPGAFPPVEIDGNYHTDGGVTTNLLGTDLAFLRAFAGALAARGVAHPVEVHVYALVNLWLAPPVASVDAGSFQAVSRRANGLLFALHQQETLERLWELSEGVRAGAVPGLRMTFRYAAIPDAWAAEPGAQALFDAPYMNRLQEYAFARAQSDAPWDRLPPGPFE